MFRSWQRSQSRRVRRSMNQLATARAFRPQTLRLEDRALPASLTVGPVENVSRLAGNQSEASIAINPTNPNNIVAVSNTFTGNGIRVYRTLDAGASWSTLLVGPGPLGTNPCCDSEVVFDTFGNLFIVYLDFGI